MDNSRDDAFWREHHGVALVWSNPAASDDVMIRNALLKPNFHLLLDIAVRFGFPRLVTIWEELKEELENSEWPEERQQVRRATPIVERCLTNMREGMAKR